MEATVISRFVVETHFHPQKTSDLSMTDSSNQVACKGLEWRNWRS